MIDDLMRNHYAYIYRLAYSILDDPDEADDATQETFIRAAAHLSEFRGEAEIKTWLSAITVNVCQAITGLDEKHRIPVILHYVQRLSVSQIAAIMATNENTVHSRLFHARRKLAMKLRATQLDVHALPQEDQR
jgi:DNA-directed RNA polymerase specialized sigma24 family protein